MNIKHPAAKPRPPYDPSSRALFEDMGYGGGGVNGAIRWKDLALESLYPVDEDKEQAERATHARKMASGVTTSNQAHQAAQAPQPVQALPQIDQSLEEVDPSLDEDVDVDEGEDGDDEDENVENDDFEDDFDLDEEGDGSFDEDE